MKKNIIFPILFFILGITILFFLSYSKDKNNNKTKENVQISSIQGNDNQIPSVTENILSIKLNNKVSLELVKVEAGSFTMSAKDGENFSDEKSHTATLTQDFYIGKYEVTQEQWESVMGGNPSCFKGDKLSVESVSWHDAMDFCEKLNKSGKAPIGYHFTLPTETQWEYAARGGKKSKGYKYSGSNTVGEVAWYEGNSGDKTHEAGTKKTNELGLYDMSGNVWEWCLDDWTDDSREAKAEFTRGKDSSSSFRVCRGGSWDSFARFCRAAYRSCCDPSDSISFLGFRVALAPVEYRNAEEKQTPSKQSTEAPSETAENETDEENIQVIELNLNNKVSLELVKVEAGSYTMSANDGENYENEVPHTATLTQDYYIGKYEVTQEQWDSVMGSNPSYFKGDKLPVEQVSWYDAMDFCEKLNKSGKAPSGYHFTLPTETQWEYASKGGKKSEGYKYSGSDTLDEVGWYYENSGDKKLDDSKWDVEQLLKNNSKTHEAGTKKANELGLYDMSGNVWEWCLDDYTDDSSKAKAEFTRGKDSSSSDRVYRGGGWSNIARSCRAACRSSGVPSNASLGLGFRIALAPGQN